ncbi:MAG TPA: potassium channel family protein [Dongiaceae bacterium]|nr:potassium channel family protein [Dongiaceae bacterium]
MDFLLMMATGTVLVVVCILVHYEFLRLTADFLLPRLPRIPRRPHVVFGVCACFAAHTAEVWLFAGVYYFLGKETDAGFADEGRRYFLDYLYFSTETYTSLGFGEIRLLTNDLRLLAGIEAMVGLVLLAWTASFNFMLMERYWLDHPGRRRSREPDKNS